jgi:uncharacterized protein
MVVGLGRANKFPAARPHRLMLAGGRPLAYAKVLHSLEPKVIEPRVPPELLDPVVAYFRPRRVILFGSVARGEAGADSDIDLPVVLDDDAPPEKLTHRAGMEARRPYKEPADVIACREDTYRRFSRIVGTLPYVARTEGVVVYER